MSRFSLRRPDKAASPKTRTPGRPPLELGERILIVTLMFGAWAGASLLSLADRR
jgi:hypothetical protein